MKPENTLPNLAPEQASVQPAVRVEQGIAPATPEAPIGGVETGAERHEQVAELSAAAANNVGMPPIITPLPVTTDVTVSDIASTTNDNPLVAGDEDLIEKEWVDKAKKIISDTKDDPHGRGTAVGRLQKDYLKKRYGKELGAAE